MDLDLWLKLLKHGHAEFFPELCGGFRIHEGTKTSSTPERGHAESESHQAEVRKWTTLLPDGG